MGSGPDVRRTRSRGEELTPSRSAASPRRPLSARLGLALRILAAIGVTFIFLCSVGLLGRSFEMANREFTRNLLDRASNPFVGVFVGILVTSLIQSSSATTSMLVGLVATGMMPVRVAIPAVMGANIGTTVTNTIVAMAHVTRRTEFRRAIACSTMHDFFNMLNVLVLLPAEYYTHFLERMAAFLAREFDMVTHFSAPKSPIKLAIKWIVRGVEGVCGRLPEPWAAILMAGAGVVVLFVSLWLLTRILKSLMIGRIENTLNSYLDRHGPVGIAIGAAATAAVQSSSVTTSFFVPIAAAGLLRPRQVYPLVLGANLGTTVTALLAAIGAGEAAGLTLAFAHLLFNVCGVLLFYPVRRLRFPIWLAEHFAVIAVRRRAMAVLYVIGAFYVVPFLLIFLSKRGH